MSDCISPLKKISVLKGIALFQNKIKCQKDKKAFIEQNLSFKGDLTFYILVLGNSTYLMFYTYYLAIMNNFFLIDLS